jgi:FAD:protein FMN transferase
MAFNAKTRKFLVILLILGWSLTLIYSARGSNLLKNLFGSKELYRDNRLLMGTFWQVTSPDKQASSIVFSEASRIEQLLSKYIQTSEISRLNRLGKLKLSLDTFYIIKRSLELCRLTDGAFDITVAPLVDLWGFSNRQFRLPGDAEIRSVLRLVGSDKIILHEKDNVVEFKIQGLKIDLGGIAKGFALDCAVKKLKDNNIHSCLINAGGQVYALGDKSGQSWKIAISGARKAEIAGTLKLRNKSASTSGDYQQYFLAGNKRYCHILNPTTGYPAESGIYSVTVVSDSGLEADALSTAVFILGKEKSQELITRFNNLEIKITE